MAWMTQMRDRAHLDTRRDDPSQAHRRARLNRLDNTQRAIWLGLVGLRTQKQKNERRRARQGR